MKCLVETMIFLEFADENTLDPDSAVEILETISYELQSMDKNNKEHFNEQIEKMVDIYSNDKKEFVKSLPQYLGLL